jgi:hypothetical protein
VRAVRGPGNDTHRDDKPKSRKDAHSKTRAYRIASQAVANTGIRGAVEVHASIAAGPSRVRRFYSVAKTAGIVGVSEMTLDRAIRPGQSRRCGSWGGSSFPARAIEEMINSAGDGRALVAPTRLADRVDFAT